MAACSVRRDYRPLTCLNVPGQFFRFGAVLSAQHGQSEDHLPKRSILLSSSGFRETFTRSQFSVPDDKSFSSQVWAMAQTNVEPPPSLGTPPPPGRDPEAFYRPAPPRGAPVHGGGAARPRGRRSPRIEPGRTPLGGSTTSNSRAGSAATGGTCAARRGTSADGWTELRHHA